MRFTDLPALGQPLDSGIFCGVTTTPDDTYSAIILLPAKPETKLGWEAACAWAETVGGILPPRAVAAMLFANVKTHFEKDWHWTSDEFDGSYAWYQDFNRGFQISTSKICAARARAVRLIPVQGGKA